MRIKVIHQKNSGLSEARNLGIKKVVGNYILFVDGDDFIGKNSLTRIKEVLGKYSDIDVMFLEVIKVFPYLFELFSEVVCFSPTDGWHI